MSEDTPMSDPNGTSNSDTSSLATILVKRRSYLKYAGTALGGSLSTGTVNAASSTNGFDSTQGGMFQPTNLTLKYEREPNNIEPGDSAPGFSWQIAHRGDGVRQAAYRIVVATSKAAVKNQRNLVWNSGKVTSSQMTAITYEGEALDSNKTYYWAVRVWDTRGNASQWSDTASFATGLGTDEWKASWIGREGPELTPISLDDAAWIWYPEGNPREEAPAETRYFRRTFELADQPVENARLAILTDGDTEFYLNGETLGNADRYETAKVFNLRPEYQLQTGMNVLAAAATNDEGPAGLLAHLRVQYANSDRVSYVDTRDSWKASDEAADGWTTREFDDTSWSSARVLGDYGVDPWGEAEVPQPLDVSQSPLIRTEVKLEKPVASARVHVVMLGYGNLYINGTCFGGTALQPWTEFDDRVLYETHNVTEALSVGSNALGLWLGRGWFSQRISNWRSYGAPRGLVQLHVTLKTERRAR